MFIHELCEAECLEELRRASFGRLGCAHDNIPYVVPIYFAFDGRCIYGFATVGRKIEWMRANPHVCLEIDERTSHDQWTSIIVNGHYEELPDDPQYELARLEAHSLLQRRAMWWEPAFVASAHRNSPQSFIPVFYRIHIDHLTGHRATPDQNVPATHVQAAPHRESRFRRWLRH